MDELWYLEDKISGIPVWGLFETQLARKERLTEFMVGLENYRVVDQSPNNSGYILVALMYKKLYIFSKRYRAYLVGEGGFWEYDSNLGSTIFPNPFGTLILSDRRLNITGEDCAKIKAENPRANVYCINLKDYLK